MNYFDGTPEGAKRVQSDLESFLSAKGHRCDIHVEYRSRPVVLKECAVRVEWPFMAVRAVERQWIIVKIGKLRCPTSGAMVIADVSDFLREKSETLANGRRIRTAPTGAELFRGCGLHLREAAGIV